MDEKIHTLTPDEIAEIFSQLDSLRNDIRDISSVSNNEIGKQRYITDNQLAEKLHVSKRTLANYRAKGEIGYYDLPGKLLYEEAEIDGFLRKYYLPPFH